MSTVIKVQGMSCNHCKMSVEKAVKEVPGVVSAEVDLEKAQVSVEFADGKMDMDLVKEAIVDAGYDPA